MPGINRDRRRDEQLSALELRFGNQFGQRHLQGVSDSNDRQDPRILATPLDATHVRAINRTAMGKLFL